jgi:hypothetical protein
MHLHIGIASQCFIRSVLSKEVTTSQKKSGEKGELRCGWTRHRKGKDVGV